MEKAKTPDQVRREEFLGQARIAEELASSAIARIDEVLNENSRRIVAIQHYDAPTMETSVSNLTRLTLVHEVSLN